MYMCSVRLMRLCSGTLKVHVCMHIHNILGHLNSHSNYVRCTCTSKYNTHSRVMFYIMRARASAQLRRLASRSNLAFRQGLYRGLVLWTWLRHSGVWSIGLSCATRACGLRLQPFRSSAAIQTTKPRRQGQTQVLSTHWISVPLHPKSTRG